MIPWRARLWAASIALFFLGTTGRSDVYSDRVQFADGLYTREMYDLALNEYSAVLDAYPEGDQNDAATFRRAECFRFLGKADEAAVAYSRVVASFKESPFRLRAAYRRARLYMDEGDYESASAHLNVILQKKPSADIAAATLYYLGECQLKLKQIKAADASFGRLVKDCSDSMFYAYALMQRGTIYREWWSEVGDKNSEEAVRLGDLALGFFEQALDRPGTDRTAAEALFQMADIHFRRANYEQSAEFYRQLLTRFPADERSGMARMQAAWSASNAGLYAEAVALAKEALADAEVSSGHDEWLYLKANAERQLLQNDAAVSTYRELLTRYPESRFAETAGYETAVAYYKMGKYREALAEALKVRMSAALRDDVRWLLAESYAAIGQRAEAIQYYRMVARDTAGSPRARDATYRLAHQLQQQAAYREASEIYNEVASAFPADPLAPQALYASGFCLAKAGAHEEAARDWRRLVESYPKDALVEDSLYQKGMSEVRLERRDDATATLDELLRRFPSSRFAADAYYWKGMLHREQEKFAAAEEALRSAMKRASRRELQREATFQLGLVLQKLNRGAEAAKLLQELLMSPLVGKFPPALLEWLSIHHGKAKAFDQAAKAADLLITTSDEAAWQQAGWVLLGRAESEQGRPDAAADSFKKALDCEANSRYAAEGALRLGEIYLTKKNAEAADTYFRLASVKAVSEGELPVRARAFYGLGKAAVLGGRHDDASRYFMSVAILYDHPEIVPESLFCAAQAFDRLGRVGDRDRVTGELATRYPESNWAKKADTEWQR
jgi:TolA-binding protein